MANSFASPGTPSFVSDVGSDGVVPRGPFGSDVAYFQYLLRKGRTVEACEPQLQDAFIEFFSRVGSRQSSVAVTNLSDVGTLPSDWQAVSPRLIANKADEIGTEFRQHQADHQRQRQQHQQHQQQSQRQLATGSGGYTGSSGLGAFPTTATHNAQTPMRSQAGNQNQQQQFAASTSGGRMGPSGSGTFPLTGSSPVYDSAARRDACQSMPTTPTPAAGRSRHSMPPQLPAQTAEDRRRRAEMMEEIRSKTTDWESTSSALLEARKRCSELEEKFGWLSMQLIGLSTEIRELQPGDPLPQFNLGADVSGSGPGQTVSTPEEAEGKKRTRGRRGGKKHANREQDDLLLG